MFIHILVLFSIYEYFTTQFAKKIDGVKTFWYDKSVKQIEKKMDVKPGGFNIECSSI